jgi:response regulator of citrate/malate metabolism
VLIIEDEPLISMQLEDLVRSLGHDVCGMAATRTQAREIATRETPGLVLADIQLADGSSGLDAVDDILAGRRAGDLHHRLSRTAADR